MERLWGMDMDTIVPLVILSAFVAMLVIERVFPGRPLPKVRFWVLKGLGAFGLCMVFAGGVPALLAKLIGSHALVHLDGLPLPVAGVLGFLVSDLAFYGLHRLFHNSSFIWRWSHQMHHSAERIDMLGANYFHPFDFTLQIVVTTLPVMMMGLSPSAAGVAGLIGYFYGNFPHLNVRTPQWIGWFIQRPEAHAVHHARGIHAYNYGNFPLWDILFGTFRNPASFPAEAGFWDGASSRVGAMLLGRDVSTPTK
jgi:sterol desaturase/sphingolipid hydroxylase (fatty acid hydroxylase superfamily)